eukprot:TRINITY_DN3154_c0_g1_i2.p1 TRINITY_DN3154_c0_g1~~TRINITY_DN3154_c0_g1_i2.p1  ORF type:complete len:364 (-),score=49.74 TRINITY_DN3154_c0_g1_i2:149-1240(-)
MKCNPNPIILKELADMGVNFDCASLSEIRTVLRMGVAPNRVIFANPCKLPSHIEFARTARVKLTTFDNEDELRKVKRLFPAAHLVLRIATDDSGAKHSQLSAKFGAKETEWAGLIQLAKELNLRLVGVSFHVGSGQSDARAYELALRSAHRIFAMAAEVGFQLNLLDIGGGFPGVDSDTLNIHAIASIVNPLLAELFRDPSVRVIAEPGRYVVMRTHILAVNIYARRVTAAQHVYYVDDGVYGSLSCIVWDHQHPVPIPLARQTKQPCSQRATFRSTIFGPTCDSIDCIGKDMLLPEMDINEWFYFRDMGAYTAASACHFNGFLTDRFFYIDSQKPALLPARSKRGAFTSAGLPAPKAAKPAA